MKILSFDIGGTGIKVDVYNEKGESQNRYQVFDTPIDREKKTNRIVPFINEIIEDYRKEFDLDGIAIDTAGAVNSETGEVVFANAWTFPGYQGLNLKDEIGVGTGLPVSVENDVNAAALAENWKGAAQGWDSVLCLTVGTGIGGAFLLDGKLLHGSKWTAGEVGYVPVKGGYWEKMASTTALVHNLEKKTGRKDLNGEKVFEAYYNGEKDYVEAIEEMAKRLAEGLLAPLYLFGPERVIIGGGIMAQHEVFIPLIKKTLEESIQDPYFLPKDIVVAKFGNEAGRVGAVYHFLEEYGEQ